MSLLLRPLAGALAVPAFFVALLLEAPAVADLAASSPALLASVGLLVAATCLLGTGIFLAGRACA